MDTIGSVTQLLKNLQEGDSDAASSLWDRYFQQLARVARGRLGNAVAGAGDQEDVAISAFFSFCRRVEQGQFDDLQNRQELWRMLVVIASRKAISWLRQETAEKRGGGRTRSGDALPNLIGPEPTPDFTAELFEEVRRLLGLLRREDVVLCLLAQRKLAGHTNAEIAAELSLAPRSIQRKIQRIRILWSADLDRRDPELGNRLRAGLRLRGEV